MKNCLNPLTKTVVGYLVQSCKPQALIIGMLVFLCFACQEDTMEQASIAQPRHGDTAPAEGSHTMMYRQVHYKGKVYDAAKTDVNAVFKAANSAPFAAFVYVPVIVNGHTDPAKHDVHIFDNEAQADVFLDEKSETLANTEQISFIANLRLYPNTNFGGSPHVFMINERCPGNYIKNIPSSHNDKISSWKLNRRSVCSLRKMRLRFYKGYNRTGGNPYVYEIPGRTGWIQDPIVPSSWNDTFSSLWFGFV